VWCRRECKDSAAIGDRECVQNSDFNRLCNGMFMTHVQLCMDEDNSLSLVTTACDTVGRDPRIASTATPGSINNNNPSGATTNNSPGGPDAAGVDVVPIVIGCVVGCIALVVLLAIVAVVVSRRKAAGAGPTDVVVKVENSDPAEHSAEDESSDHKHKHKYVEQAHGDSDDEANRTASQETRKPTGTASESGYARQIGFDSDSD